MVTADDITSTLLKATDVQSIDWQSLRGIAKQVYNESCFNRYAKLDKDNNPLSAVVDDSKYLYRRVYVDGWPVWGMTTMWLDQIKPGETPDWILAPFGTYAEAP